MTGMTPRALQVIGEIPSLKIAVGDFELQLGDVKGARLRVADNERQSWPVPLPTPVEAKGARPLFSIYRDKPLAALRRAGSKRQPAEVTGPSGIGKSTLLRQLIWEDWGNTFPDGSIFENCSGLGPDDILQRIYDQFYETFNPTQAIYRPTRDEILEALKTKRAVMVLDQLSIREPPLDQLCEALPRCAIFIGSQKSVLVGRSVEIPVEGLPVSSTVQLLRHVLGSDFERKKGKMAPLLKPLSGHPLRVWQTAAKLLQGKSPTHDTHLLESESKALRSAVYDPKRGDSTRRLLRLLAAVNGAAISVDMAEALATDGKRHRLETALTQLRFEGMIVEEENSVRLAPNLESSAREMIPDLNLEVAALVRRFTQYYSDRLSTPVAPAVPNAVMLLLERASTLEMYRLVIDLVRVVEVRWISRGQWDSWKRALEYHLSSALALENEVEQAWAHHELALCTLCRSDPVSAMEHFKGAQRLREGARESDSAALTHGNIETLIRLTTQPPPAY